MESQNKKLLAEIINKYSRRPTKNSSVFNINKEFYNQYYTFLKDKSF